MLPTFGVSVVGDKGIQSQHNPHIIDYLSLLHPSKP